MKNASGRIRFFCLLLAAVLFLSGCNGNIKATVKKSPDVSLMIGYWYSHSDLTFYDIRDDGTVCRYELVLGYFDAKKDTNAEFFNEYSDVISGTYNVGEEYLQVSLSDGTEQNFLYMSASDRLACFDKRKYSNYVRMTELPIKHVAPLLPDFSEERYRGYLSYDSISNITPDWIAAQAKAKYNLVSCCLDSEIKDRAAVYGDFVSIYYTITAIGGVPCDYSTENASFLLTHSKDAKLFYQLTDAIVGLNLDERFVGTIDVPSDYKVTDFAGKQITVEGRLAVIYNIQCDGYEEVIEQSTHTYAGEDLWERIVDALSDSVLPQDSIDYFETDYRARFSQKAFENGTPYLQYCEESKISDELIEHYSVFYTIQYLLSEEIFEDQGLSISSVNRDEAIADLAEILDMTHGFDTLAEAYEYIYENETEKLLAKEKVCAVTDWLLEQSKSQTSD